MDRCTKCMCCAVSLLRSFQRRETIVHLLCENFVWIDFTSYSIFPAAGVHKIELKSDPSRLCAANQSVHSHEGVSLLSCLEIQLRQSKLFTPSACLRVHVVENHATLRVCQIFHLLPSFLSSRTKTSDSSSFYLSTSASNTRCFTLSKV